MQVAKGRILDDKTYQYACDACNGLGHTQSGADCPYCYGLQMDRLFAEFATARGKRYYALLKAILSVQGKAIHDAAAEPGNRGEKFTVLDIGKLFLHFGWPHNRFKPFVEWLEESGAIRAGIARRISDSWRVRDILEAAKK